jgi:chromosome segregation ATPase
MGQRLLLVDSDRSFLKEHQVSLEAAFDLEVAGTPDGVAARLESGAFAAALICVEVADNKGYALCSSIRKNGKLDGVKVALISAKATEEEYRRHQSLKGRADLYLHKPIAPSALVAALSPLVPGRALDPDNPLGELVDTELGDDWLDGLKSALDSPAAPAAPVFGVRPPSAAQTAHLDAKADAGLARQWEEQVAALQEELRAKTQRLAAAEAEAQQLQRQMNSVTLNLDELERSTREAETLKARLAETEAALRSLEATKGRDTEGSEALKAQLKEALTERTELIHQVETLNHQVGEKAQRAIELLKERDRLLKENIDLEAFRTRAQDLEKALAAKDEELTAHRQDLEAAKLAQEHLNTTVEGMVEQQSRLDALHQATLLDVVGHKEKAHTLQLELAGLEATMRGQGRDLAELGVQLRQREAELEASQALALEKDQQLLSKEEILHQHQDEVARLSAQLAALRQELDEAAIQHEGEKLELMSGVDQKEAEIQRLNQTLAGQQDAHAALEREKQSIHGQLSEHRDRLQNLDGLLQEIQDKLRRGSDLAKG